MSEIKYEKYAASPIVLEKREYVQSEHFKPSGFWVSIGGEWPQWCIDEDFHLESLRVRHEVALKADANLLILDTPEKVLSFTEEYGRPLSSGTSLDVSLISGKLLDRFRLDWPQVAAKYDGIVFAPYFLELRWGVSWYSTVDVASACVWNTSVIESVTVVPSELESPEAMRALESP